MKIIKTLLILTIMGFQGILYASQFKPTGLNLAPQASLANRSLTDADGGGITYKLTNGKTIYITKPNTDIVEMRNQDGSNTQLGAIVNAANKYLSLGNSGVGGAIKKKAGEEIQAECDSILTDPKNNFTNKGGWSLKTFKKVAPVGSAWLTSAGKLMGPNLENPIVRFIIHAIAPDCREKDEKNNFEATLKNTYVSIFKVANKEEGLITSLAIPLLSSNIYACDFTKCVNIAVETVMKELNNSKYITTVYFVAWNDMAYEAYQKALDFALGKARVPRFMD
jgi:O-acetyl-ADP-ribose deacetylase